MVHSPRYIERKVYVQSELEVQLEHFNYKIRGKVVFSPNFELERVSLL